MLCHEVIQAFSASFPNAGKPRCCRVPGRVNLMGEHTDYNGLPVLPMAIDGEIIAAWTPRNDGQVVALNTDPMFPRASFANGPDIAPSPAGSWENYLKAAFIGISRHLDARHHPGINLLVSGTIPLAAGLSSSSALVVAGGLAAIDVYGLRLGRDMSRLELATLLADAEHYVGTRGGGMDHTIILAGQAGCACKIDFLPLRIEQVPLPDTAQFVVCHSGVRAVKSGAMLTRYNEGPALSRLICALVEQTARETFDDEIRLECLGDLWYGPLCLTHDEVRSLVQESLPHATTRLKEACQKLGLSEKRLRERTLGDLPEPSEGFALQARARHLLAEFDRVERGRDCLLAGELEGFGELMNASHESCAQDYQVSCPELDALVESARRTGALGARMTGAGFGGSTVSLVRREEADRFSMALSAIWSPVSQSLPVPSIPFLTLPADAADYLDY